MYVYKAVVKRWVDGDTVDVDIDLGFSVILRDQRVRLFGVDAPETRTRDLDEKERGLATKEYCIKMAPEGSAVVLRSYKDARGKFGRILAEILVMDGPIERNLNALLVEEGYAERYLL